MELNAMMTLGKIGEHVIAFAGMPTPLSRILRSGIRSECHRRASEGTDGGGWNCILKSCHRQFQPIRN